MSDERKDDAPPAYGDPAHGDPAHAPPAYEDPAEKIPQWVGVLPDTTKDHPDRLSLISKAYYLLTVAIVKFVMKYFQDEGVDGDLFGGAPRDFIRSNEILEKKFEELPDGPDFPRMTERVFMPRMGKKHPNGDDVMLNDLDLMLPDEAAIKALYEHMKTDFHVTIPLIFHNYGTKTYVYRFYVSQKLQLFGPSIRVPVDLVCLAQGIPRIADFTDNSLKYNPDGTYGVTVNVLPPIGFMREPTEHEWIRKAIADIISGKARVIIPPMCQYAELAQIDLDEPLPISNRNWLVPASVNTNLEYAYHTMIQTLFRRMAKKSQNGVAITNLMVPYELNDNGNIELIMPCGCKIDPIGIEIFPDKLSIYCCGGDFTIFTDFTWYNL